LAAVSINRWDNCDFYAIGIIQGAVYET
jgi:hypothetical protein